MNYPFAANTASTRPKVRMADGRPALLYLQERRLLAQSLLMGAGLR